MKALLLVVALLFAAPATAADETITHDGGGVIFDYITKYVTWYNQRTDVRIEGECDSACTLVLVFIPIDHICATRNAEFGFHSASTIYPGHPEIKPHYAPIMTAMMWELYNNVERLHRVLVKHHFAEPRNHPDFLMIDAQEIVKPCPPLVAAAPTAEPSK